MQRKLVKPTLKAKKRTVRTQTNPEWFRKVIPFARGANARVYRKSGAYPMNILLGRGDIVKVYPNYSMHIKVAQQFWIFKIAHELFPEHVPKVSGYITTKNTQELHMKEVPVHKELERYQDMFTKREGPYHVEGSPEYEACWDKFLACKPSIDRAERKIRQAGFEPKNENPTNLSLANPKKPIFLEIGLFDNDALIRYTQKLPEEKRKRVINYFKRLAHSVNGHTPSKMMIEGMIMRANRRQREKNGY